MPDRRPVLRIVQTAHRGEPHPRPVLWHRTASPVEAKRMLRLLRRAHPDNVYEVRAG